MATNSAKMPLQTRLKNFYTSNRISLLTILGVVSGLLAGQVTKCIFWPDGTPVDPYLLRYISLPGQIYIRAFLLLIVPLLVSSLSTSLLFTENDSNEKSKNIKDCGIDGRKLLLTTLIFFVCFSTFSAAMGISLMAIVSPGTINNYVIIQTDPQSVNQSNLISTTKRRIEVTNSKSDSILNIIMNIFPDNIVTLMFSTSFAQTQTNWPANLSRILEPNYVPDLKQQTSYSYKPNMIGICVVSFLLGLLLKKLGPEKTKITRDLLKEIDFLVNESFGFLLSYMPAGMFCWMFSEALKMHSITNVAIQLVYFYALAFVAFTILLLVFYPLVLFVLTRENPFLLYKHIFPAILVAIGTTSSAITLPMTMQCMEGKGKLAKPIAQTVLPLGMTIHMNGTALYYPMVALFVAQIKHIPIDPFMLVVLCLFSLVMSMGIPGSPSGGLTLINHIAYASVIGIDNPQDVLAFIMSFEWIWERVRTAANIIGDCFVSRCVAKVTQNNVPTVRTYCNEDDENTRL